MTFRRVGWVAGAVAFAALAAHVLWHAMQRPPDTEAPVLLATAETLVLGAPLALAAAILVGRIAAAARGTDCAERLLSLATTGLPSPRAVWGAAMRAELASIDDAGERRRFATSAGWAAVRSGFGTRPWTVALGIGVTAAAATFAASRLILVGDRVGIIAYTLFLPPLALFVVSAIAARAAGGFRPGIETGALALFAIFVGVFGVAVAEAVVWFEALGVYVMDGDAPKRAIGVVEAILDPVAPSFVGIHLLLWSPYVVLGAALGAASRARRASRGAPTIAG